MIRLSHNTLQQWFSVVGVLSHEMASVWPTCNHLTIHKSLLLHADNETLLANQVTKQIMSQGRTIKSVAVIGAGPSGLSAVKALREENIFDTIRVFERRSDTGGTWYVNRSLGHV
jgi:heterodisulfide reductase subunit A-like polyferredoxin